MLHYVTDSVIYPIKLKLIAHCCSLKPLGKVCPHVHMHNGMHGTKTQPEPTEVHLHLHRVHDLELNDLSWHQLP